MKNTKFRLEPFSFYNHTEIVSHLEKMAAKGWMIQKITAFGWKYQRIEPKQIHFAVSYYPKASEFDPEPSESQKTFHDFCAHTGWKLACISAQLQIFYNEQENPTPIETEPILELESIDKSVMKSFFPVQCLLLVIAVIQGWLSLLALTGNPIAFLSNPAQLFTALCWALLALVCIVEMICYIRWYHRAKEAAEQGEFLKTPSTSKFQKIVGFVVIIGGLYWMLTSVIHGDSLRRWLVLLICLYMLFLTAVVNGMKAFLKRRKVSRNMNRVITILTSFVLAFALMGLIFWGTANGIFSNQPAQDGAINKQGNTDWVLQQGKLPLSVSDLQEVNDDLYSTDCYGDKSFLLGRFVMRQMPNLDAENFTELPNLEYTIVEVEVPALYNTCKKRLMHEVEAVSSGLPLQYAPQDTSAWGANEVYGLENPESSRFTYSYLLCYDHTLVEMKLNWEPTQEQMQMVGQKLGKI